MCINFPDSHVISSDNLQNQMQGNLWYWFWFSTFLCTTSRATAPRAYFYAIFSLIFITITQWYPWYLIGYVSILRSFCLSFFSVWLCVGDCGFFFLLGVGVGTVCRRELYKGVVGCCLGEEAGVLWMVIPFGGCLCYSGPCSSSLALVCFYEIVKGVWRKRVSLS